MSNFMTVGSLRELIKDLDDDRPIVIARDEEGNGFQYAFDFNLDNYVQSEGYGSYVDLVDPLACETCGYGPSTEAHDRGDHSYAPEDYWTDEEIAELGPKVVVLWP